MTSAESLLYLVRLKELATSLQMASLVASLESATTAESEVQAAQIRSACLTIAKQVSQPPHPSQQATESWKRFAAILRQLELMSRHEMAQFDQAAEVSCEEACIQLQALPLSWQRRAITCIAEFSLSAADLGSPVPMPSPRLQRKLLHVLRQESVAAARELYGTLLANLVQDMSRSVSLLLTCSELVRVTQGKSNDGGLESSVLDRAIKFENELLEEHKIYSKPAAANEKSAPFILELASSFSASLDLFLRKLRVDLAGIPGAADAERSIEFKQAALSAASTLIDEAWASQRSIISSIRLPRLSQIATLPSSGSSTAGLRTSMPNLPSYPASPHRTNSNAPPSGLKFRRSPIVRRHVPSPYEFLLHRTYPAHPPSGGVQPRRRPGASAHPSPLLSAWLVLPIG